MDSRQLIEWHLYNKKKEATAETVLDRFVEAEMEKVAFLKQVIKNKALRKKVDKFGKKATKFINKHLNTTGKRMAAVGGGAALAGYGVGRASDDD